MFDRCMGGRPVPPGSPLRLLSSPPRGRARAPSGTADPPDALLHAQDALGLASTRIRSESSRARAGPRSRTPVAREQSPAARMGRRLFNYLRLGRDPRPRRQLRRAHAPPEHRIELTCSHAAHHMHAKRPEKPPRAQDACESPLSLVRPTVSVVSPPLRCSSAAAAAAAAMRLWENSAPAPSLLVLAPGSAPHRRRHLSPARASSAPRRRARLGMSSVKGREEVVLHARRKAKGAGAARAAKAAEPPGTRSRALLEIIGTPLRHI